MRISVAEAASRLADLVKRAGQGEDIVLTHQGLPPVRLEATRSPGEGAPRPYNPVAELAKLSPPASSRRPSSLAEKRKVFDDIRKRAAVGKSLPDSDAAGSQDFLYDDLGLPK